MVLTPVAGVSKPAAPTGQPQGRRRQPCERGFRMSEARTCVLRLLGEICHQTFFAALAWPLATRREACARLRVVVHASLRIVDDVRFFASGGKTLASSKASRQKSVGASTVSRRATYSSESGQDTPSRRHSAYESAARRRGVKHS